MHHSHLVRRTGPPGLLAVEVQGVAVSHPDKVLWPEDGITKLDLVRYYERIAPILLRYVEQRPLTLRPFPRGVDQPGFYMKDAPRGAPPWLETFRDVAESTGKPVDFVVAGDVRTLIWMAQYNAVEVHTWLSRIDRPDQPDWAVLDLDVHGSTGESEIKEKREERGEAGGRHDAEEARWQMVVRAAKAVHRRLEELGLRSFAKLSGQSGIHVLVPLARVHTYDTVREFFAGVSGDLCEEHPDLLTVSYGTEVRHGRVLIDYAQNARGKTTVAPYSVRPKRGAPVAAPVAWEELDDSHLRSDAWTIRTIFERLAGVGDLLEPALLLHQRLPLGPSAG